jgi:hypothetical protein
LYHQLTFGFWHHGTNLIKLVPFSKDDLSRAKEAKDPDKKVAAEIDRINNDYLQYTTRLLLQTASRSIDNFDRV